MKGQSRRLASALAVALAAVAAGAGAQTKQPSTTHSASPATHPAAADTAKPKGPSTLDGVYTDEQAARGKDVYLNSCRSCHTPASHTGATFNKLWRGKHLSDLFGYVSTRMPKNDPGSLAPEDVADVTAYLLKMNAMPVGPNELPADVDSLKQYRIEAKPKSPTPPPQRKKP
jgi:S-disulfanyl-L-cysteine oxidoreductase SoxD